jgi:hypothetical protein
VIVLVGNVDSGCIHFGLQAKKEGKMFVCHATGFWGKQPGTFTTYEVGGPKVFITYTDKKNDFILKQGMLCLYAYVCVCDEVFNYCTEMQQAK